MAQNAIVNVQRKDGQSNEKEFQNLTVEIDGKSVSVHSSSSNNSSSSKTQKTSTGDEEAE